jgi:hypothetical protein
VRVLTRSEALVVQLLLARSDRRVARVPGLETPHRRTLQSIRQRAYQKGWVRDRYVPTPAAFGLDHATFAIARPHVDQARTLAERWKARPENVLLWASDSGLFGVFLSSSDAGSELEVALEEGAVGADLQRFEVPCGAEAVPVYFDFEMAWVRATGLSGVSEGCPRPLPSLRAQGPAAAILPTPAQRNGIRGWVTDASRDGNSARLSLFRPRLEELGLRFGWLAFRSILDPAAVAASSTGFPDWCAFIRGRLRPGTEPPDLFRGLVESAGVSPFLFVAEGERVLFASLSLGPGVRRSPERVPVLPVVQTYLRDISVEQWPLGTTRVLTDHEYGRCLELRDGAMAGSRRR